MSDQWKSIGLYEHPAKPGTFGNVVLSTAGVYALRVGGSQMSYPQSWAAKIHKEEEEGDEKESAIIIRNIPESVRRNLKAKAALEGKSMQGLILELIMRYVSK